MEDDDDDQRLLHSLGVTSADIHDIERRIISQVRYAMQCTLLSLSHAHKHNPSIPYITSQV